jgi:hypothetical protein
MKNSWVPVYPHGYEYGYGDDLLPVGGYGAGYGYWFTLLGTGLGRQNPWVLYPLSSLTPSLVVALQLQDSVNLQLVDGRDVVALVQSTTTLRPSVRWHEGLSRCGRRDARWRFFLGILALL